jgi:hypothetical protein
LEDVEIVIVFIVVAPIDVLYFLFEFFIDAFDELLLRGSGGVKKTFMGLSDEYGNFIYKPFIILL